MRLRDETSILLSSFDSSECPELLYMYRSKSNLKEEMGVRNLTPLIPHWIPMLGHRETRILGFFHLPGSSKEKCVPSLGLFEQSEETISGPSKGFYIRKKRAENKPMAQLLLQMCPVGKLLNFFLNLFRIQRQKAPLKTLVMAESSFKL